MKVESINPIIINAGKADKLTSWNYNNISSPFARIYLVTEGSAYVRIAGEEHEICPGHLYIIPPNVRHDDICRGIFSHYYIHVYEDITVNGFEGSIFDKYDIPLEIPMTDNDEYFFSRLVQINPAMSLSEYNPTSYDNEQSLLANLSLEMNREFIIKLESHAILVFLFSRFLQHARLKQSTSDEQIQKAITFIYSNLSSSRLKVEQMAEVACLSTNQFIRRFRKVTGITPIQFLTNKRIEKAELLLLKKNMSNKDLAFSVGFEDPTYFCKVFKNKVGITPQKYKSHSVNEI